MSRISCASDASRGKRTSFAGFRRTSASYGTNRSKRQHAAVIIVVVVVVLDRLCFPVYEVKDAVGIVVVGCKAIFVVVY